MVDGPTPAQGGPGATKRSEVVPVPSTADRAAWALTSERCWFRIWYAGRLSRLAHSFAVHYRVPPDGLALAACGLDPYTQPSCPDPRLLGFDQEDAEHCPACESAMEYDGLLKEFAKT